MKNLIGMKQLTRTELVTINGGGPGRCVKKYQRQIIRAQNLRMKEDTRREVITIIVREAKKDCYGEIN